MAKLVKCHGGGYYYVGRLTKAQEAEFYKQLGDGPRAWFRRDPKPVAEPVEVPEHEPRDGTG